MYFELLQAAAQAAAPQNKFGFKEALEQGGFIAYATVVILGIMSFGSFFILITKWIEQNKILSQHKTLRTTFWRAASLKEGAAKLEKNSAWRQIVDDGIAAEEAHGKMTDALEAHDWLHGSLARSENSINSRLASGLPFLATVGATSPFIGLFGTVVGIYRALIAIGLAGSASIDKVAGPVGEALIMTALGLLVAVPAVLAYNYLQARNKKIAELLSGFSTDVLANINSKGAVKPAVPAAPAAAAKPAAAPAAKQ
ncbi:MAG TPA: MotA/TolQ/ExbB proton channel family protein [Novosphingobium sp.]|nr:MotA/TolQ/ExbB proton channel family protein [Novosphingobium sp.]